MKRLECFGSLYPNAVFFFFRCFVQMMLQQAVYLHSWWQPSDRSVLHWPGSRTTHPRRVSLCGRIQTNWQLWFVINYWSLALGNVHADETKKCHFEQSFDWRVDEENDEFVIKISRKPEAPRHGHTNVWVNNPVSTLLELSPRYPEQTPHALKEHDVERNNIIYETTFIWIIL